MTAAVAPPSPLSDASALSRRKRMDIPHKPDASGKAAAADNAQVPPKKRCCVRTISEDPVLAVPVTNKKAKTAASSNEKKKKKEGPKKQKQKKYDPDVPMSKEEAAAWRKEQRRNRNRESAAASRQRQRDRIAELEGQVAEWKGRFAEAMERLRRLEAEAEKSTSGSFKPAQAPKDILRINTTDPQDKKNSIVSPCSSRNSSPQPSPSLSFVQSPSSLVDTSRDPVGEPKQQPKEEEEQQKQHLIETISRPA